MKNRTSYKDYSSFDSMPKLDDFVSLQVYKKDQVIFYKEHLPYGLFILVSGKVEVCLGKRREVVSEHSFLGLTSFLKNKPYNSNAKAVTDCIFYFISRSAFQEIELKYPAVADWIKKHNT
jgi:signal-transduction protein with cAMP-binding, CBS, and nucleotidyltransferase domain